MASFINNLVIPSQTKKEQLFSAGIFHEKTSEEYKKAVEKTSDAIVNFLKCRNSASTGVEFSDIKEKIESVGLDDEQTILSLKDSLLELNEIYFKDATAFHHTNYMAHLNCPVLIPTLAAEMIISSLNTSMDTWDQSIGATLIEMKLISWTLKEIGYRDMSDGIFTSGGTQSNLMGLLLARNHFMIENYGIDPMKKGLPFEGEKFKIFCSTCAHFSIKRNAGILGLGQDSVVEVPVDEQYRMNPEALEDSIIKELDFGNTPIAIVSTAGTTDFGSIDQLKQLAKIAKRYKLWNHVDASYGGGLILSDKHKHKLQDIYLSDSVTIDYHKTFFQPISSSVFLVKNEKDLAGIAYNKIILLGFGEDNYRPQQSVRTFFNIDNPHKFYVKTALSILNMGFVRGLSPYYMSSTPEINIWIDNLIKNDLYLQKKGFTVIKEVATVGYRNRYYEEALENDNSTPYTKMLASLWRETAFSKLEKGQHIMTMAALLHVDSNENALLPVLIKKSNLSTTIWIERYLDCYLSPILHYFYTHDLVFMPHGENLIMVMEQYAPVKMIMKDIAEEVAVLSKEKKIPGQTSRIGVNVPDEFKLTYIFTDIFDCFFRYLSQILAIHCDYSDASFWELVANCVANYQKENVHLSAKHKKFDLFSDEFPRCCLNRLQIGNNKQMVNLSDPIGSLKYAGFLKNPISVFNPTL